MLDWIALSFFLLGLYTTKSDKDVAALRVIVTLLILQWTDFDTSSSGPQPVTLPTSMEGCQISNASLIATSTVLNSTISTNLRDIIVYSGLKNESQLILAELIDDVPQPITLPTSMEGRLLSCSLIETSTVLNSTISTSLKDIIVYSGLKNESQLILVEHIDDGPQPFILLISVEGRLLSCSSLIETSTVLNNTISTSLNDVIIYSGLRNESQLIMAEHIDEDILPLLEKSYFVLVCIAFFYFLLGWLLNIPYDIITDELIIPVMKRYRYRIRKRKSKSKTTSRFIMIIED